MEDAYEWDGWLFAPPQYGRNTAAQSVSSMVFWAIIQHSLNRKDEKRHTVTTIPNKTTNAPKAMLGPKSEIENGEKKGKRRK